MNDGTLTATASVSDKAGNPVTAQDSVELDNTAVITTSIDKTDDGVINGNGESAAIVVRGTVTDVENGQTVTVTINDGVNSPVTTTATVTNGEYVTDPIDASGLNDGTLTATAITSDVAGNPVTAQDTVELDNTTSLSINIDKTEDGVINGNGESAAIVVSGLVDDVEDGQVVTITISDGVNEPIEVFATVTNGKYVTESIDASGLNDGTLTATATVSDKAGNPLSAKDTVDLDNTAAITTSIDKTADSVINGNGESEAIVVRGTVTDVEDGQTVTVSISDGVNPAVTITATVTNGKYVTDPINASALNDGTLTATASVSDKAGNPVTAQDSVELDNTAVITTSIDKTDDGVINGNGESAAMVVRGTVTDVEDGQTVTVSISDGVNPAVTTTATVTNGEYVTDPINASALNDGTLTATASVSDEAGNPVSAQDSVELDKLAEIDIALSDDDQVINSLEQTSVVLTGNTVDVEQGREVTLILTDSNSVSKVITAIVSDNGTWEVTTDQIADLAEGQINAVVTVTDSAGNPANSELTFTKDTLSSVTLNIAQTDDGVINGSTESSQITITGDVENIENGQAISVLVSDGVNPDIELNGTVVDGQYSFENVDISSLNNGTITATATVLDLAGNTATANETVLLDQLASVTVDINDTDDNVINGNSENTVVSITGDVTNIENGQTVSVVVSDGINTETFTAEVINGAYTITDADVSALNDGTLTATTTVTDVAGNTATSKDTAEHDKLASTTIEVAENDDIVNAAEQSNVVINGTVTDIEATREVTVTFSDGTNSVTAKVDVDSDGNWQINPSDISTLTDGEIAVSVSVFDNAGNEAVNSTTFNKDTQATTSLELADNVINAAEDEAVALSGKVDDVESTNNVTVTFTDKNGKTEVIENITLDADGNWSVTAADISKLADGAITASVSVFDNAGNEAVNSAEFIKDTQATTTLELADTLINAAEDEAVALSGKVDDVESTNNVTVTFTDENGKTEVIENITLDTDGNWSVTAANISELADGDITASVSVFDNAGNVAINSATLVKDTQATIDVNVGDDAFINAQEQATAKVGGTISDVEPGQEVDIVLKDNNGDELFTATTTVDAQGNWELNSSILRFLSDGDYTVDVSTQDIAGNPATSTLNFTKDTQASTTLVLEDSVINAAEDDAVSVSGVVDDVESTNSITVTFTDKDGEKVTVDNVTINDDGTWEVSDEDISSLADGDVTVSVSVFDNAGNEAVNTATLTKDTNANVTVEIQDTADNVINGNSESSAVTITGTAVGVEDGRTVTVTVTDGTTTETFTAIVTGEAYTISDKDLSAFNDGEITATATLSDLAGNTATSQDTAIIDQTAVTSIIAATGDDNVINSAEQSSVVVNGVIEEADSNQTATVTFTDSNNKTIVVTGVSINAAGEWVIDATDITTLADGEITASVSALDVEGNLATNAANFTKDTNANVTVEIQDTADNVINGNSESSAVTITGTAVGVEDGRTVTVTVTDGTTTETFTAIVSGEAYTISDKDLSAFDDGEIKATATLSDLAGNTATSQDTAIIDQTAATTIAIAAGDDVVNSDEQNNVVVSGVIDEADANQTATVVFTDKDGKKVTVENVAINAGGQWQVGAADITGLADGEITASVSALDVEGNLATNETTFTKDTTATVTVDINDTDDNVINGNDENTNVEITGTTTGVEDDQKVTVVVTDEAGNERSFEATVTNNTYTIIGANLSGLNDGELIATATVSDLAGNTATDTDTAIQDKTAVTSIDVATGDDAVINTVEQSNVVVSGVIEEADANQTATVVFTDVNGKKVIVEDVAINSTGEWVIDAEDISGLADGEITASVSALDVEGNLATNETSFTKDTAATVTIDINDTDDNVINGNGENTNVEITGTTTGVEDNQTVTVVVKDTAGNERSFEATVTNNAYTITDADLSGLNDGTLTATATVSDVAGNIATNTDTAIHDKTAATTIAMAAGDDVVNASEQTNVIVSGQVTDIEPTNTATVTFTDKNGIPVTINNVTINDDGSWEVSSADVNTLADGTITATVSVLDNAGNQATNSTTFEKDTQASISIPGENNDLLINNAEKSAVVINGQSANIEEGKIVNVTVSDGTKTVTGQAIILADGTWQSNSLDLTSLDEGALTVTATTADTAGNTANADLNIVKDTQSAVTVNVGDNAVINNAEQSTAKVAGTVNDVEANQSVAITIKDSSGNTVFNGTASVDDAGNWELDSSILNALSDGDYTVDVSTQDIAGNVATSTLDFTKDTQASTTLVLDDTVINAAEDEAVSVSGVVDDVESTNSITVTFTDKNGTKVTVDNVTINDDGSWEVNDEDISSLADGNITVSVSVFDNAGNEAVNTANLTKDTVANVTVDIVDTDDSVINGSGENTNVTINGTAVGVEDGQTVTVVVSDGTNSETFTALVTDEAYTITGADVSELNDGTLTAIATVSDVAGNTATDTDTAIHDKTAVTSIDVATGDDTVINTAEQSDVVVSGIIEEADANETATVVFTDVNGDKVTVENVAINSAGEWTINATDISGLADGEITASVSALDVEGNLATNETSFTKDTTVAITVDINDTNDGVINGNDENVNVEITGTTTGVEDNQTVTVVVTDEAGNERSFEATVTNNTYTITGANLSGLNDGELTATATVSDKAGNTAIDTDTAIHDKTAVTSIDVATGDDAVINTAEQGTVVVSGIIEEADANQTATVVFTDVNGDKVTVENVAINSAGEWAINATNISGLADGEITASVSALDVEGNLATNETTFTKDTTINIDIDTGESGINSRAFKAGEVTTLNGTTDAEPGSTVTLTIFDGTNSEVVTAAVANGGTWNVNGIDVSALDGEQQWTITAAVTDSAGNTAQDSTPILDALDSQTLNESNTASDGTSSATSSIEIDNADLTLSTNQSGLEGLTVDGSPVSVILANDGLSLEVKDSQGNLVLSVALAGGELITTLHAPIDHESESLLTDIFVDALQTDADGTTELVVVPTAVTITDSAPQSSDDSFTVTEADTDTGRESTGSLVTNDSVVEGAPTVTSVTFNGTDYDDITADTPAIIVTDEGTLTVNSDGTWSFNALDNRDSNPSPQFTIEYTIEDRDGVGSSTSTATFIVQDGSAASFVDQEVTYTESDYGVTTTNNKFFDVVAGSDALVADSITFDNTIANLNALNLTSSGNAITFVISEDGKTITGSANGNEVISFSVSATQDANGKDLDARVQTTISLPLDNLNGENIDFALSLNGEDSDGTVISGAGNVTITVKDGGGPQLEDTSETPISIDEIGLDPANNTTVSQQGTVSTTVGSDTITSLAFSSDSQPNLTAGGVALVYTLSDDGRTITANTGEGTETIFVATLPDINGTSSQNLTYEFTLYRPFDNTTEGTGVPLQVEVIDNDGDSNTTTLNITVNDGGAEHTQNDIGLTVSEIPNSVADNDEDGDGQANTDTDTSFTVTAGLDDVVDMQVSITDGAAVLDSNGNQLTQTTLDENGNAVTTNIIWKVNSDGTAQGILEDTSTEVFKVTLPDVNVDAQTSATYAISFEITGAIDHTGDTTDAPQIVIPVYTEDTDGSQVTSNVTVTLNDGTDPVIANSGASVDEANLRDNDSITTTGQITVTQGSDEVVEIKLVDDFISTFNDEGYVTADGNNAITISDKNADGWYIATANGEDVLRVKFNPDGSYTYEQFTAIEHPNGDGTNTQNISFAVTAVDADGDTNNAAVTISITDDTPTIDANPVEVNLVEGQSTTIDLLDTSSNDFVGNDNNPGADGAKLSSFTYGGTEYTVFNSGNDANGSYKEVALQDETGNDTQGTLRVYESGKVVFDTSAFDQTASVDFNEQITYNVIDNDGDEVTGSIIELTTSDAEGSMSVTAQNIREDATDDSGIINSARSQITISIERGDIDQNETVSEIRIEVASLQGGELYLDNVLATDNANVSIVDGYYVFTGDTITTNPAGTVTISDLFFQPAQNSSDETQSVTVNIEATIGIGSNSRELSASDTIAVESVADTPDWDDTNNYSYTTAEDTEAAINIGATLQDTDGSETLTYIIDNIQEGLIVTADGRTLSNGDEITAAEAQSLTVVGEEHVAGTFTFDITAVATEAENNDSASASTQTVTVEITPVADEPRLFVRNQTVDEDALTPAIDLFSGLLVDQDGSETLSFEVILPEGFELVDENGVALAQYTDGIWLVSDAQLQAGNIFLKQKEDASRATDATFDITVTAIATETSTGEEARTEPDTLQLTVIGKIDPPELDEESSNDNWAFAEVDENNFTLQNTQGTEDTNLRLDFLIVTSDLDQSEAISLVISDLPDSVMLVDVNGDPASLPIVGTDANGKPMYSLTAAEMENYYLAPIDDFSGEVNFNIKVVPTEADGDTADYNIAVTTNFNPTIDNNTQSLATTSEGNEDTRIALNFNPDLIDSDGSETITGAVITGIPANTTLYVDGSEVSVDSGFDLADLINDEYPTLEDVLASDRVRLLPDEDFSGTLTVDVLYTVTDTSNVGSVSEDISSQVTVTVNGQVDTQSSAERDNSGAVTRLEATDDTITSSSRTLSLSGAVSFTEEDVDGSEVITHIEIILPDGVNIEVIHPNGAYPDGSGRWIIPIDAGTSDSVTDVINDLLADVTLEAQNSTGDIDVTVKARVADGSHAVLLSDNFTVNFTVEGDGSTSEASEVGQLQISVVDAVEDEAVDFTGHINTSLTDDENDTVTVYISADNLPEGLIIEGDGVIAIPGDDGEVAEYIIPEGSLGNLSFTSAGNDYSGQLIIPVTIIAVDDDSGDEYIDDTQSLEIDVTPVADGGEFSAAISKIKEDNRTTALGLTLALTDLNQVDDESNPEQNGGVEEVDFSQPITITLPDGVGLYDPDNMFIDNGDNTYTYNGTEAEFAAALASIGVEPIEDQSGTDIDIQITATIVDTAQLSTGTATDTTQVTNTISIAVEAVTDEAVLTVADAQGSEDADIALTGLSALLKDDDGSETISITISGVPKDAVLKDADGNLLVNNGKDGGTFNGEDTTSWTVTAEQLAGLIIVPPLDFSGEFELTLNALTQDESPGEIVQTSASFMVVVNPEADALDFSKQPFESYDGQEDDTLTIDLEAFSEEADGTETIQLTVNIAADSDDSVLQFVDGKAFITVGSETVYFTSDGNGGFSATITSGSNSIENFDFNAGGLAFGTLNMSVDVATVDSAQINGETVTSLGEAQSSEFIIELEPQADAPVWTAANDVTSNTTNNIALNLDVDLQNPATDETGYIEIIGLPDGYSFNVGEKVGDTWTVDITDIENLEIVDGAAGDSFNLTLTAFSTLNGETQEASPEVVNVTISDSATASSARTASASGDSGPDYSDMSGSGNTAHDETIASMTSGDQNV
ncbi:Ig-like domain-containing protein [Pseudoalteromonas sp. SR44-2]|uniref:Ig-like domain-containing protein n=1 Tax=Pseudoalteromonas sp. SR44-2 TaxID=2760937 RepID=UPI001C7259FC|nr:Ig-like domain-containing protein [Pseudoalteromonas sp. SR44-2]